MRASPRENMLVTMGTRAGHMASQGIISLPEGSVGEDILADFVCETVDDYIWYCRTEISFDEFIETALEKKFPAEAGI